MDDWGFRRLRGLVFLLSGVVAVGLVVYFALAPGVLVGVDPLPLVALLAVTAAVAFWQANALLR